MKTVTETQIKYVKPEIPDSVLSNCEPLPATPINTSGDLLMAYISLQSAYTICSSKVSSIKMIIQSYDDIYNEQVVTTE